MLPLISAGVIERDGVIIDAKSGTTGAGKKASEDFSFSEVDGDFRAYRVLRHQHTPEIERALSLSGAASGPITLTSHLLPTRRGILATAYGRLRRRQDRGRRGGGHQVVRRGAGVPARRQAGCGAPAGGGRHQPRAAGRRRRSRAQRGDRLLRHRQFVEGRRRPGGAERELDVRLRRDARGSPTSTVPPRERLRNVYCTRHRHGRCKRGCKQG